MLSVALFLIVVPLAIGMVEFSIDILPLTSVNGYQVNSQRL